MGLLNWLKRDLKGLKRRQSAPPIGLPSQFDPNATRNEDYVRAIEKFNEWRSQRMESCEGEGSRSAGDQFPARISEEKDKQVEKKGILKRKKSKGKKDERFSLPNGPGNRSPRLRREQVQHNTSIVEEEDVNAVKPYQKDDDIRRFEEIHCHNVSGADLNNSQPQISPPKRFYKKNSKPYTENMFSTTPTDPTPQKKGQHEYSNIPLFEDDYATPQKRNNAPIKPTRRKRLDKAQKNFDPNGPLPKVKNINAKNKETDSELSQFNGSYKHYDVNSSSIYDEFVISSKAYKGQLNVSLQEASAAAAEVNTPKNTETTQRHSHSYQKVINKHGEMVEYALPLIETEKIRQTLSEELLGIPSPVNPVDSFNFDLEKYDPIIDENFKFLTEKYNLNFTNSILTNNVTKDMLVTDLDKSTELEKSLRNAEVNNRREILNELDTLGKWAESIDLSRDKNEDNFNLNDFLFRNETMIISYPNEVQHRTCILRSTIPTPLDITGGIFRSAFVSVRKPGFTITKHVKYAQNALKRDFELLKQIRHADIAVLMAVVADRGVNQMQLVLEPFDHTLNYHIHQQSNEFSVLDALIIVQQIANATNYLQESGFIHSNISSHSVLMRQSPVAVKLAFFELATDVNSKLRCEIEAKYGHLVADPFGQEVVFNSIPDYALLLRGTDKFVKEKYLKLSKNLNLSKINLPGKTGESNLEIPGKYLPYYLEFRNQFSLYFYQAPELLSTKSKFVFPNKLSDVYSLNLLLWELLNNCVPYVIYSYSELEKLYSTKQALLPRINGFRCEKFETIFKMGLEKDPLHRVMSVQDFISLLEDIKADFVKFEDKNPPISQKEIIEEIKETKRAMKESINEILPEKLETKEKFTFTNNHLYENVHKTDPQQRLANAITNNISLETFDAKSCSTTTNCSNQELSREAEDMQLRERRGLQRTNGELTSGIGPRGFTPKNRRMYEKDRRSIQKRNSPKSNKRSTDSLFNLSQSTIFNSIQDFNNALETVSPKNVVYERTSTLKKKKREPKITAEELFKKPPKSRCNLDDQLGQIDSKLLSNKDEFVAEVRDSPKLNLEHEKFDSEIEEAPRRLNPNRGLVARAKAKFMTRIIHGDGAIRNSDETGEFNKENLSKTVNGIEKTPNNRIIPFKIKSGPNSAPASYKFAIDNFTLPTTPIARNSKLIKAAWLSDHKLAGSSKALDFDQTDDILNRSFKLETEIDEALKDKNILSIEKVYHNPNSSSCNISLDESMKEKKVNVSLKIVHNNKEIFNNSLNSGDDLCHKIQQIQLGMYETGEPGADHMKPEIKIKMTPTKNGVVLNELDDGHYQIGRQITDLTSEIRQCFENYEYDSLNSDFQKKVVDDLEEVSVKKFQVQVKTLETPKLIQEQLQRNINEEKKQETMEEVLGEFMAKQRSQSESERFETSLWHKEKSICERNSGTIENLDDTETDWISVQEAIKRIESMSKSMVESSKTQNKSQVNPNEQSIVQQSRLPSGGANQDVNSPSVTETSLTNIKLLKSNNKLPNLSCKPMASSSPLANTETVSRSCNSSAIRPYKLVTPNCCKETNLVRRATTFHETTKREQRPRRITTKVTLNLRKVHQAHEAGSGINSTRGNTCHFFCQNCGTEMTPEMGNSTTNLSTSMIAYPLMSRDGDFVAKDSLSRRSSSCSTLLKLNQQDDMYIDDDFEDSFLTPNIELVKDDEYAIQFDQN